MPTFNSKSTEKKLGILEFLQEEDIKNISFTCKNSVKGFLQKKGIDPEKIFQTNNLQFLGKAGNISDGIISITHINGDSIQIPIELLENVSLKK